MNALFVNRFSSVAGVALVLALAAGVGSGRAEEELRTQEVVVSATKTPLPVSQVTSAVEVISGEEMERKKIKTVVDALRLAQGLAVFSNGGPGSEATVRMRGANANHTLVLIDGTIMNSPTDGFFNFANLTAENIERIEILRGAQGMLWGSDAIGGVINIITKRGMGRPTASAFVEYGSFATLREGARLSGARGPVDFSVTLSRWDTSNFSTINYRRGAAERDAFHNWQASSRLGVALPREGRLEFNLRWWDSDFNFDDFAGDGNPADLFGQKQTTRNLTLSGSYEQPIASWWSQKLTLAQTNERILGRNGPSGRNLVTGETITPDPACDMSPFPSRCFFPFTTDVEILNRRLEWQHNFPIGKPLLLTAGYQFREEQGENPNALGGTAKRLSSHAGFAQAQLNFQDRVLLTAGFRQDSYNVFGDATTYRVTGGYLHKETGTKLRGSYATGFRAPTLNQLFFADPSLPFFTGNPNLRPEKSKGLDIGLDQKLFDDRLQLSASYFWNRFENLIDFSCPPPTFFCTNVNVGQAKSQGWEVGFRYAVAKGLEARGQYTYTLTRDLTTTRRRARWPVDQASAGVSYQPVESIQINGDYRFVGARNDVSSNAPSRKLGSFGVINISASYDVTKQMQIFGRIDNLLDQRYEEILFFGTPIRSVYGGVKISY